MNTYVALIRAINVGGTGKLAMSDLRALCESCGCQNVKTYIQSGNVVFQSRRSLASVKKVLEQALAKKLGKACGVLLREPPEMDEVLANNPFPAAKPNQVLVLFLDQPVDSDGLERVSTPGREQLVARGRELFIHFPDGMGKSKLKVPFQDLGTGRNLNTVNKLVSLLNEI